MSDLNAYDGLYLNIVDLLRQIERMAGNESELYGMVDDARVLAIENAPGGWLVEDAVGGVRTDEPGRYHRQGDEA